MNTLYDPVSCNDLVEQNPMADDRQVTSSQAQVSGNLIWPPEESNLTRQVDLIEDRPEDVLTWSDVIRFLRSTSSRFDAALRRG